jgi:hypothetical protein
MPAVFTSDSNYIAANPSLIAPWIFDGNSENSTYTQQFIAIFPDFLPYILINKFLQYQNQAGIAINIPQLVPGEITIFLQLVNGSTLNIPLIATGTALVNLFKNYQSWQGGHVSPLSYTYTTIFDSRTLTITLPVNIITELYTNMKLALFNQPTNPFLGIVIIKYQNSNMLGNYGFAMGSTTDAND